MRKILCSAWNLLTKPWKMQSRSSCQRHNRFQTCTLSIVKHHFSLDATGKASVNMLGPSAPKQTTCRAWRRIGVPNGSKWCHRNPQESTGIHTIPTQEIPVLSDATWCYPVPTRRSWHKLSSERSHGQQTLESVWVTWEILDSHLKSSHVTMSSLHKSLLLQTKHICQNHPISRVLQSKSAKMQSFWLTSGASAGIAGVVNLERITSICLSTATWLAEQLTLENLGMSWLILGLLGSSWLLAISISSVQFPLLSGSKQYWRTLTDLVDGFEAQQKPCNASGKAALAS